MEASHTGLLLRRLIAGLALLVLAITAVEMWLLVLPPGTVPKLFDLGSYRDTLDAVAGGALMFDWLGYPPVTLILLSPLRGLPELAGTQLWTGTSMLMVLALAAALSKLALDLRPAARFDRVRFLTGFGLAGTMLFLSTPMINQLMAGQLSLTIVTLAFLDASGALLPRKWQGLLVGLAAAFKITPLIFFPYFLFTKQWRQAAVAGASFAVATGVGFALFPRDSLYFWTHTDSSGRLGVDRRDNLSILGTLSRWMADPAQARMIWYALALAVGLAAFWRARQHFRRGEQVEAALVIGCASVVISPVAWPHYHTWVVLAGLWLFMSGARRTAVIGLLVYLPYFSLVIMPLFNIMVDFDDSPLGFALRILWESTVFVPTLIAVLGLPRRVTDVAADAPGPATDPQPVEPVVAEAQASSRPVNAAI